MKNLFKFITAISTLISIIFFVSCSGNNIKQIDYKERKLSTIYNSALDKLLDEQYEDAALEFEEVERQHPYSLWSKNQY